MLDGKIYFRTLAIDEHISNMCLVERGILTTIENCISKLQELAEPSSVQSQSNQGQGNWKKWKKLSIQKKKNAGGKFKNALNKKNKGKKKTNRDNVVPKVGSGVQKNRSWTQSSSGGKRYYGQHGPPKPGKKVKNESKVKKEK